jgi:hypothetical protein
MHTNTSAGQCSSLKAQPPLQLLASHAQSASHEAPASYTAFIIAATPSSSCLCWPLRRQLLPQKQLPLLQQSLRLPQLQPQPLSLPLPLLPPLVLPLALPRR